MFDLKKVKGIIFDYGGTIDSNGKHWSEVLWDAYIHNNVPVTKSQFRDAYVYAERFLAKNPVIMPDDNFLVLLKKKVSLQFEYLEKESFLTENSKTQIYILAISEQCYNFVRDLLRKETSLLKSLKSRYPMVLVSNFYGNVQSVLNDFDLLKYFDDIIESAIVGIRKPDPAIFRLGVESLGLPASSIVVIGDSYPKDIIPATKNGYQTIWLKGQGWNEDEDKDGTADLIISDFMELKAAFQLD